MIKKDKPDLRCFQLVFLSFDWKRRRERKETEGDENGEERAKPETERDQRMQEIIRQVRQKITCFTQHKTLLTE